MRHWWIGGMVGAVLLMGGCGPKYTIPNYETGDIEKVVSNGRSPQACIEQLKTDADELNVNVRLVDMQHQAASGPIAWIYTNTYVCTGKVYSSKKSS
ncbi:hypothetical protein YTPLAS18_15640 [Nitrospira sp.]|nr:hypothetical protein YTPLAS18_15640 [Nitrospira sp.]